MDRDNSAPQPRRGRLVGLIPAGAAQTPGPPRGVLANMTAGPDQTAARQLTERERWKAEEALRDAIKAGDEAITAERAALDNHARGRRYKALGDAAAALQDLAKRNLENVTQLDHLQRLPH